MKINTTNKNNNNNIRIYLYSICKMPYRTIKRKEISVPFYIGDKILKQEKENLK